MMTNQMDRKNEDLHETPQNQYLHHHNFAIERRGRECKQGAILELNINLDEFVSFNNEVIDDLDGLLQEVADRIHHRIRESDVVLPMGDEKFIILLENIRSLESADALAHELVDILKNPFDLTLSQHVEIGTSIGISFFSEQELELVCFPRNKKRKNVDFQQHLHKLTETH
jgi:diguanylate cyclase (GGDEF)-like protein